MLPHRRKMLQLERVPIRAEAFMSVYVPYEVNHLALDMTLLFRTLCSCLANRPTSSQSSIERTLTYS